MLRVVLVLLAIAVYISSIVDVARSDSARVRLLPKFVWFVIVVFVPILGAVLWLIFGRDQKPKGGRGRKKDNSPLLGPDDDPDFIKRL